MDGNKLWIEVCLKVLKIEIYLRKLEIKYICKNPYACWIIDWFHGCHKTIGEYKEEKKREEDDG